MHAGYSENSALTAMVPRDECTRADEWKTPMDSSSCIYTPLVRAHLDLHLGASQWKGRARRLYLLPRPRFALH